VNDLLLRPLGAGEVDAALVVLRGARAEAVRRGTMPPWVHPESDWPRWFATEVVPTREVWVAEADGSLVGLVVIDDAFVDQLYVAPGHQRRGIGSALLTLAKALRPAGFGLWVFEVNRPAIAWYERHGFELVDRTDGADNDEREPDRRYRWRGMTTV